MNAPHIKPHLFRSAKGFTFQPKATPTTGTGPEKKVFECICGHAVVWCKDGNGFYLCNATQVDTRRHRRATSFYEYRYTTTRHNMNCRPATQTLYNTEHRLVWLNTGNQYERVWLSVNEHPDEDGNITVVTNTRFTDIVVPADRIG